MMRFGIPSILAGILSLIFGFAPGLAPGQTPNRIPFTPEGVRAIQGKDICDFQGSFLEGFGVYLDRAKKYSVDYRERGGVVAVFLLSNPTRNCGIVESSLDLTHLIRKDETVQFKCYTDREGGTTWGKWGHVVGLANNHEGRERFVHARLAWRVDIKQKGFERIKGKAVVCDTSGYTD